MKKILFIVILSSLIFGYNVNAGIDVAGEARTERMKEYCRWQGHESQFKEIDNHQAKFLCIFEDKNSCDLALYYEGKCDDQYYLQKEFLCVPNNEEALFPEIQKCCNGKTVFFDRSTKARCDSYYDYYSQPENILLMTILVIFLAVLLVVIYKGFKKNK